MALFLDATALLKVYLAEDGTEAIHEILARPDHADGIFTSDLAGVALSRVLGERRREGRISRKGYELALGEFLRDFPAAFHLRPITPGVIEEALRLSLRHREMPADTAGLLQLAAALSVAPALAPEPLLFVSCDGELTALARHVGFDAFDPVSDDPDSLRPLSLGI